MAKKKEKEKEVEVAEDVSQEGEGSGKLNLRAFRKAMSGLAETYTKIIVDVTSNQMKRGVFLNSPQLTYLFGGQYPTDRIMQVQGPESSGKSTLSNYIAGELQKKKPKQPIVVYVDYERTFDPIYANRLGLDTSPEMFVLLQPENGEDGFEAMDALIKTGVVCCIILDSDAAMPTKAMTKDEYGKASFGGSARLTSDALKRINILLNKYDTNLIWISQERASMAMFGANYAATGGNSIRFFASIRNRITRVETIKGGEDGKTDIGIQIKVRNLKNKTSIPWREAIMNLYFDGGFQIDAEYVDFLISLDIVKQKGAYFYMPGIEKGVQGRKELIVWLEANPTQYDIWKKEVLEKLSGKLEADANNVEPEEDKALPVRGETATQKVVNLAVQALGLASEAIEESFENESFNEDSPDLGIL